MKLRNNIKLNNLEYKTKRGQNYSFSKYSLSSAVKEIYTRNICQ